MEEGFCREVEEIKSSEKFQAQQVKPSSVYYHLYNNEKIPDFDLASKCKNEIIERNVLYQMFNAIYGVGPVTAQKWIREGLRSVADAKRHYKQTERADERLAFGEHCCWIYSEFDSLIDAWVS